MYLGGSGSCLMAGYGVGLSIICQRIYGLPVNHLHSSLCVQVLQPVLSLTFFRRNFLPAFRTLKDMLRTTLCTGARPVARPSPTQYCTVYNIQPRLQGDLNVRSSCFSQKFLTLDNYLVHHSLEHAIVRLFVNFMVHYLQLSSFGLSISRVARFMHCQIVNYTVHHLLGLFGFCSDGPSISSRSTQVSQSRLKTVGEQLRGSVMIHTVFYLLA